MAEGPREPLDSMTQQFNWRKILGFLLLAAGCLCLLLGSRPWLSTVLPQWWKERMRKLPLFAAIAIWAVLGILAFLLAMWWLGRVPFWNLHLDAKKHAESIVKIALTLVGGVGAVAYLVIKYQERQQARRDEERAKREEEREEGRLVDTKMQQAIDQLGSDKASTRIAGVYALTDIADTYKGVYRQRVVNILCGYLRSDRTEYALDEFGHTIKDDSGRLIESEDSDEAVESTILSVMRNHLRKERKDDETGQTVDDDQLWCDRALDFHGTTFHEDVDLTDVVFERVLNFRGVKFEGDADFRKATFARSAYFNNGTKFEGYTDFSGTIFERSANFDDGTKFTGSAYLKETIFGSNANFNKSEFHSGATFSGIQSQPSFDQCKFNSKLRNAVLEDGTKAYEFDSKLIAKGDAGLPAGAVWADFPEEDDKNDDMAPMDR